MPTATVATETRPTSALRTGPATVRCGGHFAAPYLVPGALLLLLFLTKLMGKKDSTIHLTDSLVAKKRFYLS